MVSRIKHFYKIVKIRLALLLSEINHLMAEPALDIPGLAATR